MKTFIQRLYLTGVLFFSPALLFAQQKQDTIHIPEHDTLSKKSIPLKNVDVKYPAPHSYKSGPTAFDTKTPMEVIDIPQSVSTVTKELIQDKMEFTLKDAADNVSGVTQYSGFDEYTIRGFRAENARDIDGLRGYNTTYTSPLLVNIERVEIIKGPSATLYGNCDPGGTINLVSKKPLNTGQADFNIYQGSWGHYRAEADVTGPFNKSKTLLFRFNGGYDDGNSFRNQQYSKSFEVAPSLTFTPNEKIQLNVNFSVAHVNTVLDNGQPGLRGNPNLLATPISLSASQPGDYLRETDIATTALFSYKISKNLIFNSGYLSYITRQDVASHGVQGYIRNDSVNLYYTTWHYPTVTNTINNYFTYVFNTGKISHQLLLGYDYVRSSDDLNQQYYELPDRFGKGNGIVGTFSLKNPQYNQAAAASYQLSDYDNNASDVNDDVYHTQGIYIQDQFSLDKWKLLIGLREEFYKGDEDDSIGNVKEHVFLPRVGLTYSLDSNINLYGTYNKGFDPFEASTATEIFNEPFKPIVSELWETGIKGNFLNQKLYASIAVYQLTVQNVGVNANDISNPYLFVQQGENRSRGIELEAAGNILPNLSVMLSYSYCMAKVTKSDVPYQVGTIVENAPVNSSSNWIKYTFTNPTLKGFAIVFGNTQASKRNTLDPSITLPGFVVFNGGVHYRYKRFKLAINANNIFNKIYWEGAYNNISKWPGEPRNYMLNLGLSL